jgi:predicted LPLAT superfamily acyltransferase
MTSAIATLLFTLASITGAPQSQAAPAQQPPGSSAAAPATEELWAAARAGDAARVTAALDKGVDANVKTRYGATALTFAADRGHLEIVKLLIARGADINQQDTFYQMRAIDMAMANNHPEVVTLLLERGSKGAPAVLQQAIQRSNVALVSAVLQSPELTRAHARQSQSR